jgi:uncharacterized repeat protein (TIGR03803 family)
LLVGLCVLGSRITAQTFTTLHSFSGTDGANPVGGLLLSGISLYGTTEHGGASGNGSIFKVNVDGTGFTNLYSFTAASTNSSGVYVNGDGANPSGALMLSSNVLYGVASALGPFGYGTVFSLNIDGTAFTIVHSFTAANNYTNSDGADPVGITLSSNILYGTTAIGGELGGGTVFSVRVNGTGFTILHSFSEAGRGYRMRAGVILSSNTLYGTTEFGGIWDNGTVFCVNTDGTSFTNLYGFASAFNYPFTNSDGAYPIADLTCSDGTLYGTTIDGGAWAWGTVFRLNLDGSGFSNLHSFSDFSTGLSADGTNTDGTDTAGPLVSSGNMLYGTATFGGNWDNGTVFALNTDGTRFATLYSFTATSRSSGYYARGTNSDGANPRTGLILSGNILYGTTIGGGSSGAGTLFSISFRPQLNVTPFGTSVILSWPTNYAGFDYSGYTLQSATNLALPIWTVVATKPVVTSGQNIVTNPISGTRQFYRLVQ